MEDGPTARQKFLVTSIWGLSALFGAATCFPDKVFGIGLSSQMMSTTTTSGGGGGDPWTSSSMTATTTAAASSSTVMTLTEAAAAAVTAENDKDLSYCTVKTGVNDLLDYISLAVALVIPLVLGPCVVGVLQVRQYLIKDINKSTQLKNR